MPATTASKDRQIGVKRRLLRNVTDAQARLPPDLAIVEPTTTGERAQQRGLAGAVAADQRHPFASVELEIRMVKQRHVAKSERGVGENQVRHGRGSLPVEVGNVDGCTRRERRPLHCLRPQGAILPRLAKRQRPNARASARSPRVTRQMPRRMPGQRRLSRVELAQFGGSGYNTPPTPRSTMDSAHAS
jgi:hypothetical protein